MESNSYQSPDIEIIEVLAEQGFAGSPGTTLEGFGDGGTW